MHWIIHLSRVVSTTWVTMGILTITTFSGKAYSENGDGRQHDWFGKEASVSSDSFESPPEGYHSRISLGGVTRVLDVDLGDWVNIRLSLIPGELKSYDSAIGSVYLKEGFTIGPDLGWETPEGAKPKYRLERISPEGKESFFELSKYNVFKKVAVFEMLKVGNIIRLGSRSKTLPQLPEGYVWKDVVEQINGSFRLERVASGPLTSVSDELITRRTVNNVYLKAGKDSKLTHEVIDRNLQLRGHRPLLRPIGRVSWFGKHGRVLRAPKARTRN